MNILAVMIDIVLPVFGVVAIGYGVAKAGWMGESAIEGLNQFAFNIAIPLLLFRLVATSKFGEVAAWSYLISYFGSVGILYFTAIILGRVLFGFSVVEGTIFGLCAGFSNSIMIGIPLTLRAFGQEASLPLFILIGLHGIIMMTLTTVVAEIALGRGEALSKLPRTILKRLLANPIILALIAGLTANVTGLSIPASLDTIIETLGSAAVPCATFAIGTSISRFKVTGSLPHVSLIAVMKLVAHPLLVWFFTRHVFALGHIWVSVAVLLAALPTGITAYLFAERYRVIIPAAASSVLVTTVISVATVAFILTFLGAGG